jgi:hypothetical protein
MGAAIRFVDPNYSSVDFSNLMKSFHISKEQNEAAIDFPVHLSIDAAGMVLGIAFNFLFICALVLKCVCG